MEEQNLYMGDLEPFLWKIISEYRCLFNCSTNVSTPSIFQLEIATHRELAQLLTLLTGLVAFPPSRPQKLGAH